jgi:hypothetical protein
MSIETVFAKIIVKPKNSVIKTKNCGVVFYNINTNKTEIGYKLYSKEHCSWFEELNDDYLIVKEDTMYIDFIDDISHVKKGYCGTTEMLNEDYDYSGVRNDYSEVWNAVKSDFNEFLNERSETKKTLPYIMNILVHSTYCSYVGDGDVYLNITDIIRFKNGEVSNRVSLNKHKEEYFNF